MNAATLRDLAAAATANAEDRARRGDTEGRFYALGLRDAYRTVAAWMDGWSFDHPQGTGGPAPASIGSVGGFDSRPGVYEADERLVRVIQEGEAEIAQGEPFVTLDDVVKPYLRPRRPPLG